MIAGRLLRIPFERGRESKQSDQSVQDQAHQEPEPGEDEAEIVADGGQDNAGGIALAALEIARNEILDFFIALSRRQRVKIQKNADSTIM